MLCSRMLCNWKGKSHWRRKSELQATPRAYEFTVRLRPAAKKIAKQKAKQNEWKMLSYERPEVTNYTKNDRLEQFGSRCFCCTCKDA